jgi:hypothetical protein
MRLAAILGTCLLLPWPCASIVSSVPAMGVWQSTQAQENPQSKSSPKNAADQPPIDQQEIPDQSAAPPQPPSTASPACPENSQPGSSMKSNCKPAKSTGAKTRKHHRTHKAVAPAGTPAGTGPTKTVVRNGGTADPTVALSPDLSPQQASRQMESTKQLLATSDANLKKISGRQLSANQQDTVKQIKSYMEQANTAKNDRDFQRAYNLAVKANLLSAELVGH